MAPLANGSVVNQRSPAQGSDAPDPLPVAICDVLPYFLSSPARRRRSLRRPAMPRRAMVTFFALLVLGPLAGSHHPSAMRTAVSVGSHSLIPAGPSSGDRKSVV